MAHNAPGNGRAQVRYVAAHAVGRLRERTDAECHLTDNALGRALDDAVERAYARGRSEKVLDARGEPADLVDLRDCFDDLFVRGEVYALVKANERSDSRYREAVVTVLGDRAVAGIREQTREADMRKEPFNPVLSQKLAGVVVEEHPVEERPWIDPESCGSGCAGAGEDCGAPECFPARYLVQSPEGSRDDDEIDLAEALVRIRENPTLRLYRRVRYTVEVKLRED